MCLHPESISEVIYIEKIHFEKNKFFEDFDVFEIINHKNNRVFWYCYKQCFRWQNSQSFHIFSFMFLNIEIFADFCELLHVFCQVFHENHTNLSTLKNSMWNMKTLRSLLQKTLRIFFSKSTVFSTRFLDEKHQISWKESAMFSFTK